MHNILECSFFSETYDRDTFDNYINMCTDFAKHVAEINKDFYATRGQTDMAKMIEQNRYSKVAELCAYDYLHRHDITVCKPDLRVLTKEEKSWDCDMKSDKLDYHIKCQDPPSLQMFGPAWVIQWDCIGRDRDKHIKKPTPRDMYVLTHLDCTNRMFAICAMVSAQDIREFLLDDADVPRLRPYKRVVRYKRIKELVERKIIGARI